MTVSGMGDEMKAGVRGLILLAAGLGSAAAAQIPPEAKMPPNIQALHDANGVQLGNDSRCEVLEWILDPTHHWPTFPTGPVDAARHYANACRLSHEDLSPEIAAQKLGNGTFRFDVEGDALTILAKSNDKEVHFCCAPNGSLSRLGDSSFWAARYRMADIRSAMISIVPPGAPGPSSEWKYYRGPLAPPQPPETPVGQWKGQMLQREVPSHALGETRKVMVYLPPGYSKERTWPALFMADAGAVEFAGLIEMMITNGEIEPIVIISPDSGEGAVVGTAPTQFGDLRAAEYLPGTPRGAARFDPHMKFFSEEIVAFAIEEFRVSPDRSDRAVAGKSNGGVFALWAGIQRPDVFANSIAMSPGWKPVEQDQLPDIQRARFFLSAGLYEAPFIMSAQNSEAALKARGYDVEARYYAAGHMHDQWIVALREALLNVFPPH